LFPPNLHNGFDPDCCCKLCLPIQALVCGLAPQRRLARLLAVMNVYIDNSGRGQTTGDFVYAGYMAPVQNWLVFNHAWQRILDLPPRLDYWHTLHAMAQTPSKLFHGWTREECEARLYQFIGVVHACGLIKVRVAIPHDHYKTAFDHKVAPRFDNPYFLPAYSIMQVTLRGLVQNGFTEKVDFVFDHEASPKEEHFITNAWEVFWAMMDHWPEEYAPMKAILGDPPQFKNDKEVLPLQAADLFAWFARQHGLYRPRGKTYDHLAWQSLCAVPGPVREWKETELVNVVKGVHEFARLNSLRLQYDPQTGERTRRTTKRRRGPRRPPTNLIFPADS
jgi:hypothetical protein